VVNFVVPRRVGKGEVAEDEWMPFAGSHYTALVRLYHASRCRQRVNELSDELASEGVQAEAELLLDAHQASATFWENLGSCIDNLALAYEDSPVVEFIKKRKLDADESEGRTGRKYLLNLYPTLSDAYDRRTQFIHSRLIPQHIEDNVLCFNVRLLQSKETNWPSSHGVESEFVQDFHNDFWGDVLTQLGQAWNRLHSLMLDNSSLDDVEPPSLPEIDWSRLSPSDIRVGGRLNPPSNAEFLPDTFGGPGPSGEFPEF
jgi:hypothetical protein